MSDAKRDFTGVFIPAHIWESKELIPAEKMLLGEIDALSKRSGWCEAGRKHFAEWLQCTPENVSLYTSKLEKLGFIEVLRTPGYGSKLRVINARFYEQQPVSQTYGGSKPDLRGVVSPTYGGSKPGLPVNTSININKKIKEENNSENEFSLPVGNSISGNERPSESGTGKGKRKKAETFEHVVATPETHKEIDGLLQQLLKTKNYKKKMPETLEREMSWFLSCDVRYCKEQLELAVERNWMSLKYAGATQKYQEWQQRQMRIDNPNGKSHEKHQNLTHQTTDEIRAAYAEYLKKCQTEWPRDWEKMNYLTLDQYAAALNSKLFTYYSKNGADRVERIVNRINYIHKQTHDTGMFNTMPFVFCRYANRWEYQQQGPRETMAQFIARVMDQVSHKVPQEN